MRWAGAFHKQGGQGGSHRQGAVGVTICGRKGSDSHDRWAGAVNVARGVDGHVRGGQEGRWGQPCGNYLQTEQ